jgi:transposase-like protein
MVKERVDSLVWLRKQIEDTDKDLLQEMVKAMVETLMSAEADAVCGAPYRKAGPDRVNRRNGYRQRRWNTRVGSIDLGIPGTYTPFPHTIGL